MFPNNWRSFRSGLMKLTTIRQVHQNTNDYRLRRALLYVPGDDERKIKKIATIKVDSVILDCEDGVAQNRKKNARQTIRKMLDEIMTPNVDWGVRVNSAASEYMPEDIAELLSGGVTPQTLYLPKVNSTAELDLFYSCLQKAISGSLSKYQPPDLFIYTESCVGIMELPSICRHAIELSQKQSPPLFRMAGVIFGSDDLVADLGATRTKSSIEILYARQRTVLVAKAFGLQAVDMVDINLNDLESLRGLCEEGARMGYTGKQVIHPKQVEIVQEAFNPSAEKQAWANELLKAFEEHQKSGKGAFVFRNQMIDAPTMKQAQNIVEAMNRAQA